MAKKEDKMTLDEENAEKAKFGGVLKKDILMVNNAITKQKLKASELAGDLAASLSLFEKQGGRKDAMKDVSTFCRMEPADFADYWRAILSYGTAMGLFGEDGKPAQMDMLDQMIEQERNGDSISAAEASIAKSAVAGPSMGAEPIH